MPRFTKNFTSCYNWIFTANLIFSIMNLSLFLSVLALVSFFFIFKVFWLGDQTYESRPILRHFTLYEAATLIRCENSMNRNSILLCLSCKLCNIRFAWPWVTVVRIKCARRVYPAVNDSECLYMSMSNGVSVDISSGTLSNSV